MLYSVSVYPYNHGNLQGNLGKWLSEDRDKVHYIFAMEVTEVLQQWPEMNSRERKWVSESVGSGNHATRNIHMHIKQIKNTKSNLKISSFFIDLMMNQVSLAEARQVCKHSWMREAVDKVEELLSVSSTTNSH